MATTRKNERKEIVRQPASNDVRSRAASRREAAPHPVRWTREQYYRMGKLGWFDGKRVELIDGEIVEMSPIGSAHATSVALVQAELQRVFTNDCHVRAQVPISILEASEPEPDVAVVSGGIRDYIQAHPKTALLVVEVSDATLSIDRTRKSLIYAQAGIPEYWIVNLKARQLEVRRNPTAKGYSSTQTLKETDEVSPLSAPDAKIKVADLLP